MRIKMAIALFLVVGVIVAVNLFVRNKTLSPLQLAQIRAACSRCHSIPAFGTPSRVHARHLQVNCAVCHPRRPPIVDFDACKSCHDSPRYDSPSAMHDTHAALNCSRCHGDSSGLETTDTLHRILVWSGAGTMLLVLIVITANFIIADRKTKAE